MAKKPAKAKPEAKKAQPKAAPGPGHNSGLNDDQLAALFFQHKERYEVTLDLKKKADANFKNACKLAKSELGDGAVDDIKTAILLETDEGEAKVKGRIERELRVARWMALPLGQQGDFLTEPDRMPAVDRAAAEGKRAGLAGDPCKPAYDPSTPQYGAYMTAFHEGQAVLAQGIKPIPSDELPMGSSPKKDAFDDALPERKTFGESIREAQPGFDETPGSKINEPV